MILKLLTAIVALMPGHIHHNVVSPVNTHSLVSCKWAVGQPQSICWNNHRTRWFIYL